MDIVIIPRSPRQLSNNNIIKYHTNPVIGPLASTSSNDLSFLRQNHCHRMRPSTGKVDTFY